MLTSYILRLLELKSLGIFAISSLLILVLTEIQLFLDFRYFNIYLMIIF